MPRLGVSRFIALESLQANPADLKHIINIGKAAGLRLLSLYSYKGKDLTEFTSLKNLTSIDLVNPAIGSLNGLEQMPQLEGLELMDTRNLKDVSLIGELPTQNRLPKLRSRCCRKNFKPIRNVLEPCASNNGRRNRQPENHKTCFQAASNPPPAHKHSCHAIGVTMFQKTTRPAQPAPPSQARNPGRRASKRRARRTGTLRQNARQRIFMAAGFAASLSAGLGAGRNGQAKPLSRHRANQRKHRPPARISGSNPRRKGAKSACFVLTRKPL